MKMPIIPTTLAIAALASLLPSCGESSNDKAARAEAEQDRQLIRQIHAEEVRQREADRNQRAVETAVQGLDILTR